MPFAQGVIVFVHSDAFRPLQSAAVREFYGQAFSEEQLLGVVVFDHGSTIAVRFGCDQLTYRIPAQWCCTMVRPPPANTPIATYQHLAD